MPAAATTDSPPAYRVRVPRAPDLGGGGARRVVLPAVRLTAPGSPAAEKLECVAVVALEQAECSALGGALVASGFAADRVGLWVESWSRSADATPPVLDFELRAGAESATTLLASGTITAPTWSSVDLVAQIFGIAAQSVEIWLRVKYRANGRDAGVTLALVLDHVGGVRAVVPGPFATAVLP